MLFTMLDRFGCRIAEESQLYADKKEEEAEDYQ